LKNYGNIKIKGKTDALYGKSKYYSQISDRSVQKQQQKLNREKSQGTKT